MKLSVLFIACCAPAIALADLEFTPRKMSTQFAGYTVQRVYFADGDKKIGFSLPGDTEVSAEEGGALFRFGKLPQATVKLLPSLQTPQTPFAADTLAAYQKAALKLLPNAAQDVALVENAADVYPINQWKSLRLTFTYHIAGAPMRESIVFLNLSATQQIVVQTGAKEKEFADAEGRAWGILRSWHIWRPEDDKGET